MDIYFATKNEGKLKEIRSILNDFNIISINDIDAGFDIIEDGETFEENAIKKAVALSNLVNAPAMADDSGLEIDFLDKAPGVRSARFLGEDTPYSVKNAHILELLKDVPAEKRTARFVCVIACAVPGRETIIARGEWEGIISDCAKGDNGFGYDPIFYLPYHKKTSAELTPDEKNEISHRARALSVMQVKIGRKIRKGDWNGPNL